MACAKVISEFEVLSAGDVGRRRDWTDEEKIRIVEESLLGHRQGSAAARRFGISRSLLTRWRAEYRAGRLGHVGPAFTAVTVTPSTVPAAVFEAPPTPVVAPIPETIEIVLRNGRRMTVPVSIDPKTLARLLPVVDAS